jgi:hypothetical protein
MKKIFLGILIIILLAAGGTYYYVFIYKKNHHRDVQSEVAVVVTREQLLAKDANNVVGANGKFHNLAVEITGTIMELERNPNDSTMTITIGNGDSFDTNIDVYLQSKDAIVNKIGDKITVKGRCIGMDPNFYVKIKDAVIK